MKLPLESAAAGVAVLGLLAWIALAVSDRAGSPRADDPAAGPSVQDATEASAVPCAVPLAWRVDRVDGSFGLTTEDARRAVRRAASRWEEAVGRSLFVHRPDIGFPIRLVYDDRQARSRDRREREEELDRIGRRLDDQRRDLEEEVERHERMRARLQERLDDFRRRLGRHNDSVRAWNQRGGAPEPVAEEMEAAREALEAERAELQERERELDALQRSIQEQSDRYNRDVREHRERIEDAEEAFPAERVESGRYRETVEREDGRVVSVDREIRIFRFDDRNDLERIVAHELGHALGLEHTDAEGALMSREYGRQGDAGGAQIRPTDLELFEEVCPRL